MATPTVKLQAAIVSELIRRADLHEGSDKEFAQRYRINPTVWSQLKNTTNGNYDKLLSAKEWWRLSSELNVRVQEKKLKTVVTPLFSWIDEQTSFAKEFGKNVMIVTTPEMGKTITAEYLTGTLPNTFYIDCSQCKTKNEFKRAIASTLGVDINQSMSAVYRDTITKIISLTQPQFFLDEAGDLSHSAFLEIKAYCNATVNRCSWVMMGAEGLRKKMEQGRSNKKIGYAEIYSRFGGKYSDPVKDIDGVATLPELQKMIVYSVAAGNIRQDKKAMLGPIVKQTMREAKVFGVSCLRRLETVMLLHEAI